MKKSNTIRLGVIGTGGMARGHASFFQKIKGVKLAACCDVREPVAKAFAQEFGIAAVYTDYRRMLAREDLDAVTNVTPDAQHAEVALATIAAGVHILSEKPMATDMDDARKMVKAAAKAGVRNMINFSYRNSSALQQAAEAVRDGAIGELRHVESSYLQSWLGNPAWGDWRQNRALTWRLSTRHGSNGVLGDLGCHIYDLTRLLCGDDIVEIDCRLQTFDKGVKGNRLGEYVLDANDSFVSTVTFRGGALGTVHSTRWAVGQSNSLRCRAFGTAGAIEVDLDRSYTDYRICRGARAIKACAWKSVACKPTPNNYERFIACIRTGRDDPSDFANGLRIQAYLEASTLSGKRGAPVKVRL
ncbi:MAG: Gfo/Idh/MocA family oxidoreductase [Kiritimatiellae bacterium]|nr:Gfo/Idh/MocA family oxidoreductase [Kiritimatiellia bacterium]